ncbi:MAG: glycosyltransferase family 2 protein [Gemmatimonadaceae bacterium]
MTDPQTQPLDAGARRPDAPSVPIAAVILNWNNDHDTVECIRSLVEAAPTVARAVVVDNGSREESVERVVRWAREQGVSCAVLPAGAPPSAGGEWLVVLRSATNRGFSGGNNVGLAYARQDPAIAHFFLLNNDATVAPDYFARLADALAAAPDASLLTGSIFYADPPTRVWYAGGRFIPLRALTQHELVVPAGAGPYATQFVCGCTMLISRPALDALGPLPEVYFPAYCEDAEYSLRARQRGMRVLYAPLAHAYHKIGATLGHSHGALMIVQRHRAYYVRRNLRGIERVAALLYLVLTKPARTLVDLLRGRPREAWATAWGTLTGLLARTGPRELAWERYAPDSEVARAAGRGSSEATEARSASSSTKRHVTSA